MNNEQAAEILQDIFQHAVNSARAGPVTLANLPEKPRGRCVVIGAGKASAAMAAAVDAAWPDVAVSGVVVTRYGYAVPAGRIRRRGDSPLLRDRTAYRGRGGPDVTAAAGGAGGGIR